MFPNSNKTNVTNIYNLYKNNDINKYLINISKIIFLLTQKNNFIYSIFFFSDKNQLLTEYNFMHTWLLRDYPLHRNAVLIFHVPYCNANNPTKGHIFIYLYI